MLAQVEVGRLA